MSNYPATRAPIADQYRCKRIKKNGERCGLAAIRGGTVCMKHGGASPDARAAADAVLAERALAKRVGEILPGADASPIQDPEALLREIAGTQKALATAVGKVLMESSDDPEAAALARKDLQSLLRDLQASNVALLQHGTPTDPDDDGLDGYVKLAHLMDEMEANRDANMVRCPTCSGDGYLPRWTVVPGSTEPPANSVPTFPEAGSEVSG